MGEIPIIHINNEGDEEKYLNTHRFKIHHRILEEVERAIDNNIDNITIYKIVNHISDYTVVLSVNKDNWRESLDKCKNYFEGIEEYEACEKIKNIEKKLADGNI
tara:strand:- start:2041 stop:2352 length:312 start_codon:yes stop_codon:yes gene_type:complete